VKGIRGIHFYDIVPVSHLLERLSLDANVPGISSALCKLLLNSFYPTTIASNDDDDDDDDNDNDNDNDENEDGNGDDDNDDDAEDESDDGEQQKLKKKEKKRKQKQSKRKKVKSSQNDDKSKLAAVSAKQIQRCLTFVEESETAAAAFYSRLHHHTSVGSVAKLSVMIITLLATAASKAAEKPRQKRRARKVCLFFVFVFLT